MMTTSLSVLGARCDRLTQDRQLGRQIVAVPGAIPNKAARVRPHRQGIVRVNALSEVQPLCRNLDKCAVKRQPAGRD